MSGYELAAAVLKKYQYSFRKTESLPTPTTKAGNIGQAGFLPTISGTLADALKILVKDGSYTFHCDVHVYPP